ncbi:hypothetical protein B4147_3238 [Bacillus wiedmannii]|uniref:Uncharacterized protein n=1 Tax=Bacillus wiedmannii TaxID=1890302 RepID=A0A0G8C8E6_9BACI|nr:hypothetical protein B4147_3238 [Bacillus wiedmannii]
MSISLHGNLNQPLHDAYPDDFKEWILFSGKFFRNTQMDYRNEIKIIR